MPLTRDRLAELLIFNPETGLFLWRGVQKRTRKGSVAGTTDKDGYRVIKIDQHVYKAHRLAWLWMTGEFPDRSIDHIDLDKSNNRFANLRLASKSQNMMNAPCRAHSTTQVKGVQPSRKKFTAKITVNGVIHRLGTFNDVSSAAEAYRTASSALHGEFGRVA